MKRPSKRDFAGFGMFSKLPQGDVDSSRHPAIPTNVKACAVELSSTYPLLIELLCKQSPLNCYQPAGFDRCPLASLLEGDLSSRPFTQLEMTLRRR